jgi:hypothetical protein
MNMDNALANFYISFEMREGGDTCRRRAEHGSFKQLRFTHHNETGYSLVRAQNVETG